MTSKLVKEYIDELEETKEGRPEQVKEGLEIYVNLWRKAIEKGVVAETDSVNEALVKIEKQGGLYEAAGD